MQRILLLSDMHIGSIVSVMPEEVWIEERNENRSNVVKANRIQRELYKRWEKMGDVARFDKCLVLGDSVDGPNVHSVGFELWTTNLHQQVSTADDLLSMVKVRGKEYYGVQGSFYHVRENTSSDLAVMDGVGGTFDTDLVVEVEGVRIHLNHFISWSGSATSKATAPQGELVAAAMNDKYMGEFDLLVRGHRHEFLDLRNRFGHIICLPAWKARDAFQTKNGLKSTVNDTGFSVLEIRGNDIDVEHYVWTPTEEYIFRTISDKEEE